jgi:hypothetical protein
VPMVWRHLLAPLWLVRQLRHLRHLRHLPLRKGMRSGVTLGAG